MVNLNSISREDYQIINDDTIEMKLNNLVIIQPYSDFYYMISLSNNKDLLEPYISEDNPSYMRINFYPTKKMFVIFDIDDDLFCAIRYNDDYSNIYTYYFMDDRVIKAVIKINNSELTIKYVDEKIIDYECIGDINNYPEIPQVGESTYYPDFDRYSLYNPTFQ